MSGPSRSAIKHSYHPGGSVSPSTLAFAGCEHRSAESPLPLSKTYQHSPAISVKQYCAKNISPSLQRARKPYRVGNAVLGTAIALFAGGVYAYSISSVKQDDFSDVEDLLPPVAERAAIRSIEDETRLAASSAAKKFQHAVPVTHSPDSPSKALPSAIGVADAELGIGSSTSSTRYAPMGSPSVGAISGAVKNAVSEAKYEAKNAASNLRNAADHARDTISEEVSEGLTGISAWLPRRLDTIRWVRERGLVQYGKGNVLVWYAPSVDNVGRIGDGVSRPTKGQRWV